MSVENGKGALLDQVLGFVAELITVKGDAFVYRVITNDTPPSLASSYKSYEDALDYVRGIGYSNSSSTLLDLPKYDLKDESTLYVFSDYQKAIELTRPFDSLSFSSVNYLSHSHSPRFNFLIDTAFSVSNSISGTLGRGFVFQSLQSVSETGTLYLNESQVGLLDFQLRADTFFLTKQYQEVQRGELQIQSDDVVFDNQFFFTVDMVQAIAVLEIKGKDAISLEKAFENEVFSYSMRREDAYNSAELQNKDLVILHGISANPLISEDIEAHINRGGYVLVIPNEKGSIPLVRIEPYLQLVRSDSADVLKPIDTDVPYYDGVFVGKQERMAMPKVRRVWDMAFGSNGIMLFDDGNSFYGQLPGAASVFVLASPLDKAFTDFFTHSLFIPTLYQLAFKASRLNTPIAYYLGKGTISIPLQVDENQAQVFRLVDSEKEIIPIQQYANGVLTLELPLAELTVGHYDLIYGDSLYRKLAFNYPKSESVLEYYSPDEVFDTDNSNFTAVDLDRIDQYRIQLAQAGDDMAFWKWSILLALMFLAIEVLLIRYL
ncbi:hypothetical protein QWY31_15785 [Cytophagales bacterium LB-30]|uniref:Cyclic di-GMP-binding protein n=1 Tax=Shiella aurantiaca TaxID=3058365 RepID=A0ABT8F927_9BACT|nr:hypothetical protein [Shiella aurantiaca]MDN4166972.1 hypothetical protein [Shiella aurantiaca]